MGSGDIGQELCKFSGIDRPPLRPISTTIKIEKGIAIKFPKKLGLGAMGPISLC
jgi:hypothetical protein